jgi:hypothetical protein
MVLPFPDALLGLNADFKRFAALYGRKCAPEVLKRRASGLAASGYTGGTPCGTGYVPQPTLTAVPCSR